MKDKTTAGILGVLVGGLGVHKFYLGRTGWGIAYLLFCWTLLPTLAGFIEGILYLTMDDDRFDERYNAGMSKRNSIKSATESADFLIKLHEMRQRGIISEEEYESGKSKLLG